MNLCFLGFVHENVSSTVSLLRRSHVAGERPLRVVEVPAPGMDETPAPCRVLLAPLAAKKVVGFHFKKALKDQGKAMRGRFFERKNFDVIVVEPEMSAMTFDVRFREEIVEESVASKACSFEFQWRKVQHLLQNAKCVGLPQNTCLHEVADLSQAAPRLRVQRGQRVRQFRVNQDRLLAAGQKSLQLAHRFLGMRRELAEPVEDAG